MTASIWAADTDTPEINVIQSPFRNRIINGDMRIDQRNGGAAVAINSASLTYSVDRWAGFGESADGVFTLQRLSSSPPLGFTHYLRATVTTADAAIGAAQVYGIMQRIEGYNVADFLFGTANALNCAVSFRFRSSLTGTFSFAIRNNARTRSYLSTFLYPTANSWQTVTVIVPGDVLGVWLTDNGLGLDITVSLGAGTNFHGIEGWNAANFIQTADCVNLIGTLGATLDIGGVQIEKGDSATEFEHRLYNVELAACQRYFIRLGQCYGHVATANIINVNTYLPVEMRSEPVLSLVNSAPYAEARPFETPAVGSGSTVSGTHASNSRLSFDFQVNGFSGLTPGFPCFLGAAQVNCNAEL